MLTVERPDGFQVGNGGVIRYRTSRAEGVWAYVEGAQG